MPDVVINVEELLIDIENILDVYVPFPENVIYVKNIRFPVRINTELGNTDDYPDDCILAGEEYIKFYAKNDMISNTPWHPFKCISLVSDLLTIMVHSGSKYRELFIRNPYIGNGGVKYISKLDTYEHDIISSYVKNITDKDASDVLTYASEIYKIVSVYTERYPDNYFTFDTESINFIIKNHGDIRSIRWDEYSDHIEYNTNH